MRQVIALTLIAIFVAGCGSAPAPLKTGAILERTGDEIVVAGQFVHTGTPVVLWMDPGGYDGYRVERRFAPLDQAGWDATHQQLKDISSPNRYGLRKNGLTDEQIDQVRGGGWDLPLLQATVDQFVLHFDVCGTSRQCFNILHDHRGLSVHFLLDLDGTIYQTLDVKERAWHATIANDRSVGIEIANIGAYPIDLRGILEQWYRKTPDSRTRIVVPLSAGMARQRTPDFVGYPIRSDPVIGEIHGQKLAQYDLTPQQYAALIKLTANLCTVLPKIRCDYPRDASGKLLTRQLTTAEFTKYTGLLGHYHVQAGKIDPGPALQWDRIVEGAKAYLHR